MGALYTCTSEGRPLRTPPTPGEREELLDRFYRPHHRRLLEAVDVAFAAHSHSLILDAHSFPSRPLPYEECQDPKRPQICIGTDRFHTPGWLEQAAVQSFEAEGFEVSDERKRGVTEQIAAVLNGSA
jgi:N-formylglutamate amidohydrolase